MRSQMIVAGLLLTLAAGAAHADSVALQNASATFSQTQTGNFFASTMIDGDTSGSVGNGWAIFNGSTSPQTAAFETVSDLSAPAIQISMIQNYFGPQHTLGRFRFSVTTDDRATFCDGLQTGGNVTASWTVISPFSFDLPAGVTSSVLGDGSVLIGGTNPDTATYTGLFALPFGGITGLRLEALEDPSLPTDGPGRQSSNGNFVLSELTVATAVPTPGTASLLALAAFAARRRR